MPDSVTPDIAIGTSPVADEQEWGAMGENGRSRSFVRLVVFTTIPAVSAVVPLLALPAITSRYGATAWATIAVAQSLGAAAAVIVELGWGLTGTLRVARQAPANRRRTAALSIITRAIVLLPVLVAALIVVPLLVDDFETEAVIITTAAAIGSVNLVWYFIGTGSPFAVLLTDALPRVVFGVAAAVLVSIAGWPVLAYAVALLAGSLVAPTIGVLHAGVRPSAFRGYDRRRIGRVLAFQRSAVAGRVISAGYIALPVTLVSIVAPTPVVAVFAATERLQRMVLTGLQSLPNALQNGVGSETDPDRRRRRAHRAVLINLGVGAAVGIVFTVVAPTASHLLFSGEATVPTEFAALGGLLITIVSCSRITGGIVLVNERRFRTIAVSAAWGAAVGIPSILGLSAVWGAAGGLAGELLAEATVLAVQLGGIRRAFRDRTRRARPTRRPRVAYVRVEHLGYPRNHRIRGFLESVGDAEVTVLPRIRTGPTPLRFLRDALLLVRSGRFDVYVVAEFSLVFAPVVWLVSRATGAFLVVDGFVGKYETAVEDWGLASPRSPRARWYRLVDHLSISVADVYLVDTKVRAAALSARYPTSRVRSLPVGAPDWALAAPPAVHDELRLLYYGNYLPLHGLPTVIDALALVDERVVLTLVGEAEHAGGDVDTRARAQDLGVLDRCTFLPPVPAADLAGLIAQHDVVLGVFGSSAKAGSVIANKVWQGLACARTVVTQESPALDEIRGVLAPGQLLTVPAEDPRALADRIAEVAARTLTANTHSGVRSGLDGYVLDEFSAFLADLATWADQPSLAGHGRHTS